MNGFSPTIGTRLFVRAVCLFSIGLVGCGPSNTVPGTVPLKGTLLDGGKPLEVQNRAVKIGRVVVGFWRMDSPETPRTELTETTSADVDESGNFELVDGIAPGTYLITIRQWDPYPSVDRLKSKFSEQESNIIREFAEQKQPIELKFDLTNGVQ
jgi:hypothetical protein